MVTSSPSFNSMKVRLKPLLYSIACVYVWFQFHEGPIKTIGCRQSYPLVQMFQFHEGPIKTPFAAYPRYFKALFQFHEGPIKTHTDVLTTRPDIIVSIP